MKYLICSDTHGRLKTGKELFNAIEIEKPDKIIHLGDFLYNGPRNGVPDDYDPMALSILFNKIKDKLIGVCGNCDSRIDADLIGLKLHDFIDVDFGNRSMHLSHGDAIEKAIEKAKSGDLVLYGHTHLYELENRDGLIFLNPGSIGFPKGGNPPTYATIENGMISIKKLDSSEVIKTLKIN